MFNSLDELISELNEKKSIKFRIKVSANSRVNSIDFCEETIKIKAPAIEGKANKAITEYIGEIAGVAKSRIRIISGQKASVKTIYIQL